MPIGRNLFTNFTVTGTIAAPAVTVPIGEVDFIAVGIQVSSVSGTGAQAIFQVQWSFDGQIWTDPGVNQEDIIATVTAPTCQVKRIPVKAQYWRLGAVVTGFNPSFVVTGNALVW